MAQPDEPRVSIVVPVFNPGPWIRPLLDSLDAQTTAAGDREVLLVDDGSTDGTEHLLDAWAAERSWARVIHCPPSGWPSRPRNIGLAQARGAYVYLVDHDDWLAADALERMGGFAVATGADVVVGRMAGVGRWVPRALFRTSVADAHPPATPLQDSMTTHVLFRRSFLDRIDLRFDDTLRRLEDHLFMVRAYTAAERVAVYSDAPVYFHAERDDGEGAGYRRYRADEYYPALGRSIDTVVAALPAGGERDAYVKRWIRIELVGRLQSDAVRWLPRSERDAFFAGVQRVFDEHVPADVDASLGPAWRWPTALARTATAAEFYRGEDIMTTTVRSEITGRPGSAALGAVLPADAVARAVRALGADEPLPAGRAAPSAGHALARRLRLAAMTVVSRFPGGGLHRALVTWARTPRLFGRRVAAVVAIAAPLVAALMPGREVWALGLVALGLASTTWLAVRSLRGRPTALRQALALLPGVAAIVADTAPGASGVSPGAVLAQVAAIAVAAALIAGALGFDRRWRRTDVRAHAARSGDAVTRLGWIATTAIAVGAVIFGVDAAVILT